MNKRLVAARVLTAEGILLLIVAAIHLLAIPTLRNTLMHQLSAADFQFIWPPFLLAFAVVGILLVPVRLSTVYCASGVRNAGPWAWLLGITNAIAILSLRGVLLALMERRYFNAPPFLIASILITLIGVSIVWPLLWVRTELRS